MRIRCLVALSFATLAACASPTSDPTSTGTTLDALKDEVDAGTCGKPDPTPPPPTTCTTVAGGSFCSAPDSKDLFLKQCAAMGADLTSVTWSGATCTVTCCPPSATPPPPTAACVWSALGDFKTCVSYPDLKTKAVALCGADAVLQDFVSADDCKGGATSAKVECCASTPTKDPPPPAK